MCAKINLLLKNPSGNRNGTEYDNNKKLADSPIFLSDI